jgi:F-type H+-transporting ATPase subunit b
VERDKVLDLLDEISNQLPGELKQAKTIVESRNEVITNAKREAESILKQATDTAKYRADQIVTEAGERAEGIVRRAEAEAELERKKATEGIKREIVDVSAALAEKMLEREVNENDHRALIDSFIDKIGEE